MVIVAMFSSLFLQFFMVSQLNRMRIYTYSSHTGITNVAINIRVNDFAPPVPRTTSCSYQIMEMRIVFQKNTEIVSFLYAVNNSGL